MPLTPAEESLVYMFLTPEHPNADPMTQDDVKNIMLLYTWPNDKLGMSFLNQTGNQQQYNQKRLALTSPKKRPFTSPKNSESNKVYLMPQENILSTPSNATEGIIPGDDIQSSPRSRQKLGFRDSDEIFPPGSCIDGLPLFQTKPL